MVLSVIFLASRYENLGSAAYVVIRFFFLFNSVSAELCYKPDDLRICSQQMLLGSNVTVAVQDPIFPVIFEDPLVFSTKLLLK